MTKLRGDRDLLVLARRIENLAYKLPAAEAELQQRFRDLDAHPASTLGNGMPHGNDVSRPVEAAMFARFDVLEDLEMIASRVVAMEAQVAGINAIADRVLRGVEWRPQVVLCSCAGHDGAKVAWTPHAALESGNGWADPSCHDIAEEGGLCLRCARRKQRWVEYRAALAVLEAADGCREHHTCSRGDACIHVGDGAMVPGSNHPCATQVASLVGAA